MADEKQENAEKQPEKFSESSILPIDDNINKVKEENKKTTDSNDNRKTHSDSPQPFVVKIEKSKGLNKAEIISLFGVVISGSHLTPLSVTPSHILAGNPLKVIIFSVE